MRHFLVSLLLTAFSCSLLISSCATIVKRNTYKLRITSNRQHSRIVYKDSTYDQPAKLGVTRSKKDLPLILLTDTINRGFLVKAAPNTPFLFANLLWLQAAPAAYLIDLTNPHRFYYGRSLHLDYCDTATIIRPQWMGVKVARGFRRFVAKTYPVNRGDIALRISLPYANSFYYHPEGEQTKANAGFIGISAGLDYSHKDNQYLSLTASKVIDFPFPFPAAIHRCGAFEQFRSAHIGLSNNHRIRRYSLGYGLAYARNTWALEHDYHLCDSMQLPTRAPVTKVNHSVGFLFSAYVQMSRHLGVGIIYRPTVLSVARHTRFCYEHVISLDFAWSFRIKRRILPTSFPNLPW